MALVDKSPVHDDLHDDESGDPSAAPSPHATAGANSINQEHVSIQLARLSVKSQAAAGGSSLQPSNSQARVCLESSLGKENSSAAKEARFGIGEQKGKDAESSSPGSGDKKINTVQVHDIEVGVGSQSGCDAGKQIGATEVVKAQSNAQEGIFSRLMDFYRTMGFLQSQIILAGFISAQAAVFAWQFAVVDCECPTRSPGDPHPPSRARGSQWCFLF